MTDFEDALTIILHHEGGLSDDPRDPGGITKFGISIKFAGSINLDIDGDGKTTGEDIRALTRDHASRLYKQHFWLPLRCDQINDYGLALMMFDCGVNQGIGASAKLLQRSVGAVPDGQVGPLTLASIARHGDYPTIITEFAARRGKRYAETNNFDRFGLGWMRRVFQVHSESLSTN